MKKNIMIRPMRREDVRQVALLEKRIFSRPWSAGSFEKALAYPEQIMLVAERCAESKAAAPGVRSTVMTEAEEPFEKYEIVGYSIMYAAADQADVSNIAVDPDFREKRIGDALMREMIDSAKERGVREVFLEVRKSNAPAIGLYQKYGFEQIGVRKAYYEDPKEDALLMKMHLTEADT